MDEKAFVAFCKHEVVDYLRLRGNKEVTEDDIYVVWLCKVLQNSKALVSTTIPDGMYYEITYNGDKSEVYVDAYKKVLNYSVII